MDLTEVKPINHQNEQEVFRVMERNGSFEVDEAVTNSTETGVTHLKGTQVVSPSECRSHPMSKMFAPPNKRRLQSERPKPTSQLGGAPVDPYRRLGRRVSTVLEEDHEEDSSTDEKKLNERSRDIMYSLSDDASDPFNSIEDGDLSKKITNANEVFVSTAIIPYSRSENLPSDDSEQSDLSM